MALLYYENLGVEKPEILMGAAFWGLTDFYQFLDNTEKHLRDQTKKLGWEPVDEKRETNGQEKVWVRLIEIPGSSEDFDSSLKSFLDEDVREVRDMKGRRIKVLSRNSDEEKIQLEGMPDGELLELHPNTYQITRQIRAIRNLQDEPTKDHIPLLELFRESKYASWPDLEGRNSVTDWSLLHDEHRSGTEEQREFVEIALNTPDFAFLDGPPGSGKTTAICELIVQLAKEGKRVLLCASTHVAVDNVLERLMDDNNGSNEHNILPVRIGDSSNVSEKAKQWQFKELSGTEKKRIIGELEKVNNKTESQAEFLRLLKKGSETMERIILESANLVCGTTIGILQHPDIKNRSQQSPQFDMLIIDEASKTTFQGFLVPALLAKRWVLVGDPKQLSPYVDDESMAVNVAACLDNEYRRNACIDVFQAMKDMKNRVTTLAIHEDPDIVEYYKKQADHYTEQADLDKKDAVVVGDSKTPMEALPYADIVVADKEFVSSNMDCMPLDVGHIRNADQAPDSLRRRMDAYLSMKGEKVDRLEPKKWEAEVAWRLARVYEQRLNSCPDGDEPDIKPRKSSGGKLREEKLREDLKKLYPFDGMDVDGEEKKSGIEAKIDIVQRIALPSILESLRDGFGKNKRQRQETALTEGLPDETLKQRLVRLTYQHRMHPDIADFPSRVIYKGKALRTDHDAMKEKREWGYNPNERIVWRDVQGRKDKTNANLMEVDELFSELESFDKWARSHREDKPWEVALLTFYRGQEKALRKRLREWTGQKGGYRHFHRESKENRYMDIQVCTVDRFQGQEADLVLLSFSNDHPTSFLESLNRLNVAITRARYRLVVFGNRQGMKRASGVLGEFSKIEGWGKYI